MQTRDAAIPADGGQRHLHGSVDHRAAGFWRAIRRQPSASGRRIHRRSDYCQRIVYDPEFKRRVIDDVLEASLRDNVKARRVLPDGSSERIVRGKHVPPRRSQQILLGNRPVHPPRHLRS
ncbi:MAG: Polyphosphate kinase C-terminal domain 2 [Planctomycetota bacterium]